MKIKRRNEINTSVLPHTASFPFFKAEAPSQSQLMRQKMLIGKWDLIPLDFIQLHRHFLGLGKQVSEILLRRACSKDLVFLGAF